MLKVLSYTRLIIILIQFFTYQYAVITMTSHCHQYVLTSQVSSLCPCLTRVGVATTVQHTSTGSAGQAGWVQTTASLTSTTSALPCSPSSSASPWRLGLTSCTTYVFCSVWRHYLALDYAILHVCDIIINNCVQYLTQCCESSTTVNYKQCREPSTTVDWGNVVSLAQQ